MQIESVYSTMFLDQDGDLTCWTVSGQSDHEALQHFLMDLVPESEAQLAALSSVEDLEHWAQDRECYCQVVKH